MADTSRSVTLANTVKEVLALTGNPKKKYFQFFQLGINSVRELNLFHINNVRRVLLDMDENNAISFPSDFLNLVAVGIPLNGRLHTFTHDNKLLGIQTTDPEYDWNDLINEKATVGYGVRGGKGDYYFMIDWENEKFKFNGTQRSEVILQYVSSGIDSSSTTSIPVVAKQAVMSYIIWKSALYDPKVSYAQTALFREDYEEEVDKLRFLQTPSIDDIRNELYKSFTQAPKR